jgi:hypothetical protein
MDWYEDLPVICPPPKAVKPCGKIPYYRLVKGEEPTQEDFVSLRVLNPDKAFKCDECYARSLSVWSDIKACRNQIKYPRNRSKRVAKIILPNDSGKIIMSMNSEYHYSWWRRKDYNPIPFCVMLEDGEL